MDFIAIDFETADCKNSIPCSLGITLAKNNIIAKRMSFLINPEIQISPYNTRIHGITNEMVNSSPAFPNIWSQIELLFRHYPVVAHNATFDLSVQEKVSDRYNIKLPIITYYCTLELYRINYPKLKGYRLDEICSYFNINLVKHHCCNDDSCAAAELMLRLLNDEQTTIFGHSKDIYEIGNEDHYSSDKTIRENKPANKYCIELPKYERAHTTYDNIETIKFKNSKFVITGDFENYSRLEIQSIIESKGGICTNSVSSKTDYLIVAYQNLNAIKDIKDIKSEKLIKAERLRNDGNKIKIISDNNFLNIIKKG